MQNYKIIISPEATDMLKEHIAFIANVDKKAAINTKNQIVKAIKDLKKMPNRFPFFNEPYIPQNKYHKMFIEKWYLVLYQIKDDTVYIDYILDCRQDYQWLI
ncbi:MAG: type II toxin-antitoxin system RelE/ParE family toxin [Clostridia bacterium]|nr:type II toxin-antitoxin system RelE/ParE family toxin [Clostridia bacterium]